MRNQDEINKVEIPAYNLLTSEDLGWDPMISNTAKQMRSSLKDTILENKLKDTIKYLNPWISEDNVKRVIRSITNVQATSTIEANEKIHTILTSGTTVKQDKGDGLGFKNQSVNLIDFKNPENNEFTVVRQFNVKHIKENIPDIVLFINGIPIVVIECKSPKIRDPIKEGIEQLFQYQEKYTKYEGTGCPQLFNTAQIVVSTCYDSTMYATNNTPLRHWSTWKEPYPLDVEELQKKLGHEPSEQEIFLYGVCSKENLLDLIKNFIVFDKESGKSIKKLAKYQQFRAVNRIINRILQKNKNWNKGGVIWHWQGSGKSLTMLWTALKLRQINELSSPTILIVTDRNDLDSQIHGVFRKSGLANPIRAETAKHLQKNLMNPVGQIITTTIQKFQGDTKNYPKFTDKSNIFVLVDEAHRSQYKSLAKNMAKAIPNAFFLGFTGTPLKRWNNENRTKETIEVFGDYIDIFDHNQSVKDGITVPIFYESRMANLHISNNSINKISNKLNGYSHYEKSQIIQKLSKEQIVKSDNRMEDIARDIIKHYENKILPNNFKAQIVAFDREAAIKYKKKLDNLNAPSNEVLISSNNRKDDQFSKYVRTKNQEDEIIRRFKEESDPKILIVCDKLLTGFDAPIEQAMYLDSSLKKHNLLQAMGRVNRKNRNKEYGIVIDYWGVGKELEDALDLYKKQGIEEGMVNTNYKNDILPKLQAAHRDAINFFKDIDYPSNNEDDIENYIRKCIKFLEPEDYRTKFDEKFKLFSKYLDMLLPDPITDDFKEDFDLLSEIRIRARNRYRDEQLSIDECTNKIKELINQHIQSKGITKLLEPISILDDDFDKNISKLSSNEEKASEIEHAIKHEIDVKKDENPIFYESIAEKLNDIINNFQQGQIDSTQKLKELDDLKNDLRSPYKHAQKLGVNPEIAPFYALITENSENTDDENYKHASVEIYHVFVENTVIDWQKKEDIKREIRRQIKRILRKYNYQGNLENITIKLIDLAENRFVR